MAIFSNQQIDLRGDFDLSFQVFLGTKDATGADGITFALHNDPFGPDAVGGGGVGMGVHGLADGLALEFDTWQNLAPIGDMANDHVGWIDTDTANLIAHVSPSLDVGNIEDGAWHDVTVSWDAQSQTLGYTFDGVQGANLDSNVIDTFLGGSDFAYFGFAGATGNATNLQQVQVVSFNGTLQPNTGGTGGAGGSGVQFDSSNSYIAIDDASGPKANFEHDNASKSFFP